VRSVSFPNSVRERKSLETPFPARMGWAGETEFRGAFPNGVWERDRETGLSRAVATEFIRW
jgi:hypothetical protein